MEKVFLGFRSTDSDHQPLKKIFCLFKKLVCLTFCTGSLHEAIVGIKTKN